MYGLSERSYEELIQILDSVPEVEEVLIYGSRARGNYDHASDIDLSLIGRNLTKRSLRMLNDKLYDSRPMCCVTAAYYIKEVKAKGPSNHNNRYLNNKIL